MSKLIIFDLDGVLIDSKEVHFYALNNALSSYDDKYRISIDEHHNLYVGLPTKNKLQLLSDKKGLPTELHSSIWYMKQSETSKLLKNICPDIRLMAILEKLVSDGFTLACCSNAISSTVHLLLDGLSVKQYFDIIISNEDVKNVKPHPEMFWVAMIENESVPEETLIVEDSPHGLLAAFRTNSSVLRVRNSKDLTYEKIIKRFGMKDLKAKWQDEKLNVVIPLAGEGKRFKEVGYTFPKPLIEISGKPMIQVVVENLNIDATYTFIVRQEHVSEFNIDIVLKTIEPKCNIVVVDRLTEGAACTTLLAKEYFDNEAPLLLANSDQYVDWNSTEFLYKMYEKDCDGGILTFESVHPKWSYAKIDENGYVDKVAEKEPISNNATVGIYYYKHGSDFVKYAEKMIEKNIRVNNEFYVCPIYNEFILDEKKIITYDISKYSMWGLGTPEDLDSFKREKLFMTDGIYV